MGGPVTVLEMIEELRKDWVVEIVADTAGYRVTLSKSGQDRRFIYRGAGLAVLVLRAFTGAPDGQHKG